MSSKPSSKRVRRCEGKDRISQLHDDILVYILSSLPLKESATTSLVAPRWSQLWKYTPDLVFRNSSGSDPVVNITGPVSVILEKRSLKNIAWVNSVVDSHKALSLNQFTLDFYLHDFQSLPKWLTFALSRRVETLELDFHYAQSVIDLNTLSNLNGSSLKELRLRALTASGEAIGLFVRSCSSLERLVLDDVTLTSSDLVIAGGSALSYLELYSRGVDEIILTRVSAPSLTRLNCNYDLNMLFLEDVPNLVDASFYLVSDSFGSDTMDSVANVASNLEILTITLDSPKAFPVPQMPRLKKLVLDYSSVNIEFLLPVTRVLQASPCLREFNLKISDYLDFPATILEVPKRGGTMSPHRHLGVFEFSGFGYHHMKVLKYIVDNCIALGEIIITPSPRLYNTRVSSYSYKHHREVIAAKKRKAVSRLKKRTELLLSSKLPHNIKLRIL